MLPGPGAAASAEGTDRQLQTPAKTKLRLPSSKTSSMPAGPAPSVAHPQPTSHTIPRAPSARVAKQVDARDLSNLSTRFGNGRCEWGQIRGTSTTARCGDCNPELSPSGAFLTPVSRSEGVAIRTQQAKVFEPIVFVVSVDVVEFERNRLIQPALQATADADRC
jgi:hypothetical protein